MSLSLNETFRIAAPPDRVWQFLKNPADVVTCLPGAELTGMIDDQTYTGRVKVKVGPITAAYAGKATLTQVDDTARRMQIVAEGKESGGSGSARMTMTGVVTPVGDGESEVSVDAAIDIAGRVMQFGRGLIESVNKQLFRQFADAVQSKLHSAHAAEQAEAAAAAEPSTLESGAPASTVAGDGAPSGDHGGTRTDAAPAPSSHPPAPRPAPRASAATPSSARPIAQGEELRALPLLWKVFVSWLRGLFGGKG
jgi:carbon monoxide dehydrogenase subunit G